MSQSLIDLVKQYGDARADWVDNKASSTRIVALLAEIHARIEAIRDAVYSVHGVDETVPAILDGVES